VNASDTNSVIEVVWKIEAPKLIADLLASFATLA